MEYNHSYIKDGRLNIRVRILIFFIGVAVLCIIRPWIAQHNYNRAVAFYSSKYHGKAIKHLEKTIFLSPKSIDAYNKLGSIYEQMDDYEKAIAIYKRSFKDNPENSTGYLRIGAYYATKNNDCTTAMKWFKKAVNADSKDWYAYTWLGSCYKSIGRNDLVLKNYYEMKEAFPENKKIDFLIKSFEDDITGE
ncbi:MAG: tetratricopeptide repeat protein [Candidatus Omnitrophica bacterium]|nr:tetratricopeptide repeat protein [Candidatus Omnitrophota bacterium]